MEQIQKDQDYLSVYKNKKAAKAAVFRWMDHFGICMQKTSLMSAERACFNYTLKKCDGACVGEESSKAYAHKIAAFNRFIFLPALRFSDFGKREKKR